MTAKCRYRAANGLIASSAASLSNCASSSGASAKPLASRSARRCARCSPGRRTLSPGSVLEARNSRMWRSTSALKRLELLEARRIERQHELPGIVDLLRRGVEVDAIAAEEGAVEHAGQHADHQRQPGALVAAHRQQQRLGGLVRIGDGGAGLRVDHPVRRKRLVLQAVVLDGAVGHDRGGDVEHQRRLFAGRHRDRQRIGAEQIFGAAGERHVVGVGDRGIEPDHVGMKRQRGIDAGGAGVVRHAQADPGDAAVARQRDGGLGRARHHQMAHAVVAVDQRGRRRGAIHLDVGARIEPADLQPMHVLRQPEHAVRVGAGEIGLQHQLGHLGGVGFRQAGLDHGVGDQGAHRGEPRRGRSVATAVTTLSPAAGVRRCGEDRRLVGVGNVQAPHMRHAIEHGHVVRVIAAEQHALGADMADHEFQHRRRMQDGVVVEAPGDVLRLLLDVLLRLRPHPPAVLPARRLIGREAAAMREHDLQFGMAVDHAAEIEAGGGDGGVERIADQVAQIIGAVSRSAPATLSGWTNMKAPSSSAVAQSGAKLGSSRFLPMTLEPIIGAAQGRAC